VSQATPQGTGVVFGAALLLLGAANISIILALHSLLIVVEACIGLTDLQQQAWMGKGAIMDGDKASRDDCGTDVEGGGLFRSLQ
jgi:hypothetical protein